ncbi:hypothetical protein C2S52_000769 [Perilla frutescens var. hirtella]|nr:hypothetical protein C2S52_000769 [Perilla frutescens var. hirtella]
MANTPSTIFSISSTHNNDNMPADDIDASKHNQTPNHHDHDQDQLAAPFHYQKIIAEVLGTYIFVFAGCGAALVDRENTLAAALVPALALMSMIYAVGHVSGAHFNPAVTAAFAVARRLPLIQVPMYVLSQLFGSTLASLTLRLLFRHDQRDFLPMLTQYSWSSSTSDIEALVWEFIFTFILTFTIFGVASDHRANNALCGVAIGGTLLFNALLGGSITGASMNPARSLGPALAIGVYKNQWVYVVGPLLGGVVASLVYSLLRPTQSGKQHSATNSVYNDLYVSEV